MESNSVNSFLRGPPKEHSYQVWFKLAQQFGRTCLKKLLTTHKGQWTTVTVYSFYIFFSHLSSFFLHLSRPNLGLVQIDSICRWQSKCDLKNFIEGEKGTLINEEKMLDSSDFFPPKVLKTFLTVAETWDSMVMVH